MSLEKLKQDLPEVLGKLEGLAQPIAKLAEDHWSEQLAVETATDIGPLDIKAGLTAEAHITRRAAAPLTADGFVGEEGEDELAWASLVLSGKANGKYSLEESVGGGATVTAGFEAGAGARLAQHRRVRQDELALAVLRDLAGDLRLPFSAGAARGLGPEDVLEVDLGGSVAIQGSIGWQAGLVQELSILADNGISLPIEAGIKAGAKLQLQLGGDLRLVVRRTSKPDWVALSLHKRSNQFLGAELGVKASVSFIQVPEAVEGFLARVLELPDGWRDRLKVVHDEIGMLRDRIAGWQDQVRDAIDAAIPDEHLSLAALLDLSDGGRLGQAAQEALTALPLDRIEAALGQAEEVLQKVVEDGFDAVAGPIEELHDRVGSWLEGYDSLRGKVEEFLTKKIRRDLELDLKAGINRSRSSEAILELEFDLSVDKAARAYEAATRGSFEAALQLALPDGDNGVEIQSGTLKRTLKEHRYTSFKLNLFGLDVRRDLTKFREVEVEEDIISGTLSFVGKAGATLSSERRGQLRSLSVGFGLATLAHRKQGAISFGQLGIDAVIGRTAKLDGKAAARAIPVHVRGAVALKALDEVQEATLVQNLLREKGTYEYTLEIELPEETVRRAFLLDSGLDSKQTVPRVRQALRTAVSYLDIPLDANRGDDIPLSSLLTKPVLDLVANRPQLTEWRFFHPDLPGGRQLVNRRGAWAYLLHAHDFVGSYLMAREKLLLGRSPWEAAKGLMKLAGSIRLPVGFGEVVPLDAKYLAFVLLGQAGGEHVRLTFRRGKVEVTV